MSDIIDLTAERNAREQPDDGFVSLDEYGRTLFTFMLEYEMDGATYGTRVIAYSMEDAENRVVAMRESLIVKGQVYSMIPA
jgi:hypothetical protein